MSTPARPHWQPQGPADRCKIGSLYFGWLNCTPCAFAMAMEKATLGRVRMSGCQVRKETGDRTGGTTIPQNAAVARAHGVPVEEHVGSRVATPKQLAQALAAGRGAVVQGNTSALLNSPRRSTSGPINHAVYVNEGRHWHEQGTEGYRVPEEVLVYDPAADGRRAGWGTADQGPTWWPWSLLLAFAAALKPDGDNTSRRLGPGRLYSAFFPDTEPHVHLRYTGSKRTTPFPRKLTVKSPSPGRRVNVRKGPSTAYSVAYTWPDGQVFTAYQQTSSGQELAGSRLWYGNHDGLRWVHSSGLQD